MVAISVTLFPEFFLKFFSQYLPNINNIRTPSQDNSYLINYILLLKETVLNVCSFYGTLGSLSFSEIFIIDNRNIFPGFMNISGDIDLVKGLSRMQIF